jgi:anti-anti-sigma regulatory factor
MSENRMEKLYSLKVNRENRVLTVSVVGYFNDDTGLELEALVREAFSQDGEVLILDMALCTNVNSMGVASLFGLCVLVVNDLRRKLFLVGLDSLKITVLNMAGIFTMATFEQTVGDALRRLREKN